MLQDPDNFQSALDKEDEAFILARKLQDEEDKRLARELSGKEKQTEEARQREMYRAEIEEAKREQEAESGRRRERERKEIVKRKLREDKASLEIVKATTKACPGYKWAIEKNEGCAHMTCRFSALLPTLLFYMIELLGVKRLE
jgi:hypothetical protein